MDISKDTFINWETKHLHDHKKFLECRPTTFRTLLSIDCIDQVLATRIAKTDWEECGMTKAEWDKNLAEETLYTNRWAKTINPNNL
jgi:hypothetical protein